MTTKNSTSEKKKVWLISTKDVENLFNKGEKKILFNSENSESYCIDQYFDNDKLTLIDFYSDYLNKTTDAVFNGNPTNRKSIEEIIPYLKGKNQSEESSLMFDKIFKLNGHDVFLTRCFPDKMKYDDGNHIGTDDLLKKYWLFAYANTVAKNLRCKIEDIEFFAILHSSDTNGIKYEEDKEDIDVPNFEKFSITRTKYSHDVGDTVYKSIILNEKIFSDITYSIDQHIQIFLNFPDIHERSKILENNELNISNEDVAEQIKMFFLDCNEKELGAKEKLFKELFSKTNLELL